MMRRSLENRDAQARQLQDAVTNVEKHFGELCQIFAAYVRKTARLRDKADLLIERLEAKVAEPLKAYGAIVKMKRDDLKATLTSRNGEAKQLTQKEHVSETHLITLFHRQKPNYRELQWMLPEQHIDKEDLEVFRNSLYPPDYSSRLDTVRANSKSPLQRSLSAKCVSGKGQVSIHLSTKKGSASRR
ncbi:Protein Fam92A [Manis pentadactyla]|nr:Protein Fam92A [Manis pentadactyla]